MARYNTVSSTNSLTASSGGSTTLSTPNQGLFTLITGVGTPSTYTITLPNPTYFTGSTESYYNTATGTVTLNTPSGVFNGPQGTGTANFVMNQYAFVTITSDGTNYDIVSNPGGVVVATSGTFSGTLTAQSTVSLSPAAANVAISPTSGGTVTISPAGALTMSPGTASAITNTSIGSANPLSGAFTTLSASGATTLTLGTNATAYNSGGTLTVTGGVGISGSTYTNGIISTSGQITGQGLYSTNGNNIAANTVANGGYFGFGVSDTSGWSLSNLPIILLKADTTTYGTMGMASGNGLMYFARTTGSNGTLATYMQCDSSKNMTFSATTQGSSATSGQGALFSGGVGIAGTLYTVGLVETSSIAFKENVQPLINPLDKVLNMMGVTYDRKDGGKQHEVGLIAEDVYKVAPELVSLDDNGKPYGIQYTKLTAFLIESIKSLKAEINELKQPKAKKK